jgi:pimeloyl-ACP methyl ester carboxylesterase
MIEFVEIQNILAGMGIRSIAIDTPGYGMSDTPSTLPTIPEVADNIVPVLDYLKVRKVVVAGHHTGAAIGVAFAARHPDRTVALIVQGVPLLTDEENAKFLARPDIFHHTPVQDGSHLNRGFKPAGPDVPVKSPERLAVDTWFVLSSFFAGYDIFPSVFRYDMWPDVKAIKAPTLILSDAKDIVFQGSTRMAALRPDFTYVAFSQEGEEALMVHPEAWSKMAADFASKYNKP